MNVCCNSTAPLPLAFSSVMCLFLMKDSDSTDLHDDFILFNVSRWNTQQQQIFIISLYTNRFTDQLHQYKIKIKHSCSHHCKFQEVVISFET